MPRGRYPKSKELRVLQGSRAEPSGKKVAISDGSRPSPTINLQPREQQMFDRLVAQSDSVLCSIDSHSLTMYCMIFGRWQDAIADVRENGLRIGDKPNPSLRIAEKCESELRLLGACLGFSPTARKALGKSLQDKQAAQRLAEFI